MIWLWQMRFGGNYVCSLTHPAVFDGTKVVLARIEFTLRMDYGGPTAESSFKKVKRKALARYVSCELG